MKIEIHEVDDVRSLASGRPELWLRVLSANLLDLPRVLGHLDQDVRVQLDEYELVDHHRGDGEDAAFEDWWVFAKREI